MDKSIHPLLFQWMYRILFLSFFLPMNLQTWIIILCSILIVFTSFRQQIKVTSFEWLMAFLLGGGYLFYVAYLPFTSTEALPELYSLLERKISLLLLPFIFLLFSKTNATSYKPYLLWFVYGAVCMSLLANGYIVFQVLWLKHLPMNHVNYRQLFEQVAHIHPTYFGMYCCFALGILWLNYAEMNRTQQFIQLLFQFILLISLLLLAPKSALLALALIFMYALFFMFKQTIKTKLIMSGLMISTLLLAYMLLPFFQQRINEVFMFLKNSPPDLLNNSMDMRKQILQIDWVLLKKHWLFGIGPVELQQQLNLLLYVSSMFAGQSLGSFNTHNEYMNQWLCFGLFGFLFFVFILLLHLRKAIRHQHHTYLFLWMIIFVTFFTENVLSRQHGILFYALFTSLFFFQPYNSLKK